MTGIPEEIDSYIEKAIEADAFAATETDAEAKLNWLSVAASWRLLAERTLVQRTGGELLLH
jgi:hypothetical protein